MRLGSLTTRLDKHSIAREVGSASCGRRAAPRRSRPDSRRARSRLSIRTSRARSQRSADHRPIPGRRLEDARRGERGCRERVRAGQPPSFWLQRGERDHREGLEQVPGAEDAWRMRAPVDRVVRQRVQDLVGHQEEHRTVEHVGRGQRSRLVTLRSPMAAVKQRTRAAARGQTLAAGCPAVAAA
jgi:hypothetical protein